MMITRSRSTHLKKPNIGTTMTAPLSSMTTTTKTNGGAKMSRSTEGEVGQPSLQQRATQSLPMHPSSLPAVNGQSASKPIKGNALKPLPVVSATAATAAPESKPTSAQGPKRTGQVICSATQDRSQFVTPHAHDVLCGRGGGINNHAGNRLFRKWVHERKSRYNLAMTKLEKTSIAREVLERVHAQVPRGRFLLRDDAGPWIEIDDSRAMSKTSQALREGAPTIRAAAAQQLQQQSQSQSQQLTVPKTQQHPPATQRQTPGQGPATQRQTPGSQMQRPNALVGAAATALATASTTGVAPASRPAQAHMTANSKPQTAALTQTRPITTQVRSISPPPEIHAMVAPVTSSALEPLTSSGASVTAVSQEISAPRKTSENATVSRASESEMGTHAPPSNVIPNEGAMQTELTPSQVSSEEKTGGSQGTPLKRPRETTAEESGSTLQMSRDQFVAEKRALIEDGVVKGDQKQEEAPSKKQRRVTLEPERLLAEEETLTFGSQTVGTNDVQHDLTNGAVVELKEPVVPVSPTTTPMPFPPSPCFTTIAHIGEDDETVSDFAPLPASVVDEIRHMDVFPLRTQGLEREHSIALSEMSWNNQVPNDDEEDFFNPFENEDAILLAAAEALVTDESEIRPQETA